MNSDSEQVVTWELRRHVAILTLNRPSTLNAWTMRMEERYFDLLERAAESEDVRAIVVTGAGRGFCAGADMGMLNGIDVDSGRPVTGHRPQNFPHGIPKPIVAAINGPCAGIGMVQALMCDVRFAAPSASFTTAFSRVGLVAEHGISWLLPRTVGLSRAQDLLLSSRVVDAPEAREIGLVEELSPEGKVVDMAFDYARRLAERSSPTAMAVIKRQIYSHGHVELAEAMAESNTLMMSALARDDFREGVASHLEKRQPHFLPVDLDAIPDRTAK